MADVDVGQFFMSPGPPFWNISYTLFCLGYECSVRHLEWVSANSLGLLASHGINCCLCLWYANVSFFSSSLFLGRRCAQGVGKGVYLLWLWNKPPYVNASAATLASILFTVTLSHLIRTMLIASKIVLRWSDSSCPIAVLRLCLKGEICDPESIFCSHRFCNS